MNSCVTPRVQPATRPHRPALSGLERRTGQIGRDLADGAFQTSGLIGITLTVVGVLAVVRAGIDDTWNAPQANVIGLHQSALVGAGEILLGLLLIAGSASVLNRSILGFTGALVFVAGVALEAVSVSILDELGTARSSGAFLIAVGIVAIISAMLPTVTQRSTTARLDR